MNAVDAAVASALGLRDLKLLISRAGRILDPPCGSRSRRIGLNPKPVVHGVPELRLAAEVAFGRLDRDVAQ